MTGYLSLRAGENLSDLLCDIGKMGATSIYLDLSQCSPICVGGLERLLEGKFDLASRGIQLTFHRSTPTLSKVLGIMGLQPDGEPLARAHAAGNR